MVLGWLVVVVCGSRNLLSFVGFLGFVAERCPFLLCNWVFCLVGGWFLVVVDGIFGVYLLRCLDCRGDRVGWWLWLVVSVLGGGLANLYLFGDCFAFFNLFWIGVVLL